MLHFFFFQAEDGIRDLTVTGVQTCALPILLAERGPRRGAPLDVTVAYDPPCHLLHAQRIAEPPHQVLRAIPVLRVTSTADAEQCCGSAGLFALVEPAMSRAVLAPKLASLKAARPQVVATGNPGCRSEEHTSELQSQSNLV